MKNKKVWLSICAAAVVVLVIWFLAGGKKEKKVEFETTKVERQDIHTSITATGTIEPVTSVTVGTQVSGIVAKLYVDYNSIVKKGQVIAELDKTNLISELNRSRADLSSAQSTLNYETANYKRYKTLYDKGLDFKRAVKCTGSTGDVQRELESLSEYEVCGIRGVAVKCLDITKNSDCEGSIPVLN